MNIPDSSTFSYAITYKDLAGLDVPENAPTTVTVVDPADGSPSTLATVTPDPSNDQLGTGSLTAGQTAGSFKLHATMGTLNLESEVLDITPGAPAVGVIALTVV